MKKVLSYVAIALMILYFGKGVIAQTAALPYQMGVTGLHTVCTIVPAQTPPQSQYCFASDGLWESDNGAPFFKVGVVTTSGVTSLNGKQGNLIIGGTATAPAVTVTVN